MFLTRHYCDRLKKASSFCLVKLLVLIRLKRLRQFAIYLKLKVFCINSLSIIDRGVTVK